MSLAGPEASATAEDDDGIFAEINITPLTDVFLVLLIICMVSSSAMVDAATQGRLDVALPRAGASSAAPAPATTLVVGVVPDGRLFVRGAFVSAQELRQVLEETFAKAPQTTVIVDADGALAHRQVVAVIDQVRSAGFATVGIGAQTDKP